MSPGVFRETRGSVSDVDLQGCQEGVVGVDSYTSMDDKVVEGQDRRNEKVVL